MFLVSYTPKEPVIDKLKDFGALPVVDYLCSPTYEEAMYEYVVPGNTIGELATLTERPYNGVITAETHSQVYIMNRDILKKAMEMDSDPVNGSVAESFTSFSKTKFQIRVQNLEIHRLQKSCNCYDERSRLSLEHQR
jgi:hypothetical protein